MRDFVGVRTRIGLGMLMLGEGGSVELPPRTEDLCCPQCGTLLADKGQCLAQFMEWPNEDGINVLRIIVDCRSCGCVDKEPMLRETFQFLREQKEKGE